jgi:hypothetical protein
VGVRITKGMIFLVQTEPAHDLKCHGHMIRVSSFEMIVSRLLIDVTTGLQK